MKKIKMFVMAVAAIMTVGSLFSCGSDGDDNGSGSSDPTYVSGIVTNSFMTTDYTLDAYDVTVVYKDISGQTKTVAVTASDKMLLTKEMASTMSLGAKSWYEKRIKQGKKVYFCNFDENLKVPANVTYSLSAKFTFKGENAKTHTSEKGEELVTVDECFCCYATAKTGKGGFSTQSQLDVESSSSTSLDKAVDFGTAKSRSYDFKVVLTANEFVAERLLGE